MDNKPYIEIAAAALKLLRNKGKSDDVSSLLMEINVPEPGKVQDLLIEISLTAKESEEVGIGCKSMEDIEKLLEEIVQADTTL